MAEKSPPKAPFVDKVVADASSPPRVRLLTGYVGGSSEKDCVRLYADPELTSYLEIPGAAVRHSEPVEGDALGAVHLWVDRDADVISRGENLAERRGRFLDGPLVRGPGAEGPMQPEPPGGPGGIRGPNTFLDCPPSRNCDFTTQIVCPPTEVLPCIRPSDIGCRPSLDVPCDFRTQVPAACGGPTRVPGCDLRTVNELACGVRTLVLKDCVVPTLTGPGCGAFPTRSPADCGPSIVDNCRSELRICQTDNAVACGGPITFQGAGCDVRSFVDGCRSTPNGCFDGGGFEGGFGGGIDPGRFGTRPRFRGF